MLKSICVYCGSADGVRPPFRQAAREMGVLLARRGIRLVFGGGRTGLMGDVADAALEAGGEVIGVITEAMNTPALSHAGLTRLEVTSTIHQRKAQMHALADGFIALPGGFGTLDELFETITWGQIGIHQKPVGLLNTLNYYDPLLTFIEQAIHEGFIFAEHRVLVKQAEAPEALLAAMEDHQHPTEAVKRWMREDASDQPSAISDQ
jgi:uncharacterized protein (TIGR00730 family)